PLTIPTKAPSSATTGAPLMPPATSVRMASLTVAFGETVVTSVVITSRARYIVESHVAEAIALGRRSHSAVVQSQNSSTQFSGQPHDFRLDRLCRQKALGTW